MAKKQGFFARLFGRSQPSEETPPPSPVKSVPSPSREQLGQALTRLQEAMDTLEASQDGTRVMSLFDMALPVLDAAIRSNWDVRLAWSLAVGCVEKGHLLFEACDYRAALDTVGQAVTLFQKIMQQGQEPPGTVSGLAHAYIVRGFAATELKDHRLAQESFTQAASLLDRLVEREGRRDLGSQQAKAHLNRALAMLEDGTDREQILPSFDRGIAILTRLVNEDGRHDLAGLLNNARQDRQRITSRLPQPAAVADSMGPAEDTAKLEKARGCLREALSLIDAGNHAKAKMMLEMVEGFAGGTSRKRLKSMPAGMAEVLGIALLNKAQVLEKFDQASAAEQACENAVTLFRLLVEQRGRQALEPQLVLAHLQLGRHLARRGAAGAVASYDQAISILQRLVESQGRQDLAGVLSEAHQNIARAACNAALDAWKEADEALQKGEARAAISCLDRAITALRQVVVRHGQWDVGSDDVDPAGVLGVSYLKKITALNELGDAAAAGPVCDHAVSFYEELVGRHGRASSADMLAAAYSLRADNLTARGDPAALESYDKAINRYEQLLAQGQRPELAELLQNTRQRRTVAAGRLPAARRSLTWQPGEVCLDEFVIERLLGEGGMGKVYLVRSQSSGQRFAVKKTKLREPGSRRDFLAELQTWIDLPEHPHLAACRFFRTVGEEEAIFAEYVDGGSLADWIEQGRLTQLPQLLQVAVEFAWGLHAAHERGLVHQDVKPGNVLLTDAGTVKVTDFGLARARARAGESTENGETDALVSCGGMTRAYCSPEQASGQPLSRQTDVWSWGVSVLQMFTGEVTWGSGVAAPEALEEYLASGPADFRLPRMPAGAASVLRKCFEQDPVRRWKTLAEAAEALREVCRQETDQDCAPVSPPSAATAASLRMATSYRGVQGAHWAPPQQWLRKALEAAGRDPALAETVVPARADTRKGQAIADLTVYDDALRIFDQLVAGGRNDLVGSLASLCCEKALIHEVVDDVPGALALYDRVIELHHRFRNEVGLGANVAYLNKAQLLHRHGKTAEGIGVLDLLIGHLEAVVAKPGMKTLEPQLAEILARKAALLTDQGGTAQALSLYDRAIAILEEAGLEHRQATLADAYLNKALAVARGGDPRASLPLYDRALGLYEKLAGREGGRDAETRLALAWMNKAKDVSTLGQHRAAVELADKAIRILDRLVRHEGQHELADQLAITHFTRANALNDEGDKQAALRGFDEAIGLWERLVNLEGRRDLSANLATAYMNKANVVDDLGQPQAAIALFDRAIQIQQRLVEEDDRKDQREALANALSNKANTVNVLGDPRGAVALYDRALQIYEQLVDREGQRGLAVELAHTLLHKGSALDMGGDGRAALPVMERAIAMYEQFLQQEGRSDLADDLASAYLNKAVTLVNLNQHREAVSLLNRTIAIREELVNRQGRRDLTHRLANAYVQKGAILRLLNEKAAALPLLDRAVALYEELVQREGRSELTGALQRARQERDALASPPADQTRPAQDGRPDAEAQAWMVQGNAALANQNFRQAAELLGRAAAQYERLVQGHGYRELTPQWAYAVLFGGMALFSLEEEDKAGPLFDRAVALYEQLV